MNCAHPLVARARIPFRAQREHPEQRPRVAPCASSASSSSCVCLPFRVAAHETEGRCFASCQARARISHTRRLCYKKRRFAITAHRTADRRYFRRGALSIVFFSVLSRFSRVSTHRHANRATEQATFSFFAHNTGGRRSRIVCCGVLFTALQQQ